MAPLPTESRIFADRYRRELKRREAAFANRISPGTNTWSDAVFSFFESIDKAGSPIKRASLIHKLTDYLNENVHEGAHFLLDCGGAKRSAGLMFATLSAGEHPLVGIEEEGVNIRQHFVMSQRNGAISAMSGTDIAYVSRHAIGRLHERGCDLTDMKATCALACVGIIGLLTRGCSKHIDGQMSLVYDDTLITGSLKHALKNVNGDGREINGTFYDVRTALPTYDYQNQAVIDQGVQASHAVAGWLDNRTISRKANNKLGETIPFLPRRDDDYTFQHAVMDQRSNKP
jgi:hypothetical protein